MPGFEFYNETDNIALVHDEWEVQENKANYERWVGSKSHTNTREVGASYKKQQNSETDLTS